MANPTKGPLSIRRSCKLPTIVGADGKCVASLGSSYSCRIATEIEANAARIVLAWNTHDDMLTALLLVYASAMAGSGIGEKELAAVEAAIAKAEAA